MCYLADSSAGAGSNGRVKSGWRRPVAQDGVFTPEGAPNFLEVEWEYTPSEGVGIIDVMINGMSIHKFLKDSDLEALRDEAMGMVEAAEPR